MRLWQNIRTILRQPRSRFGQGDQLAQAELRSGRVIRPEPTHAHSLTIAFARADVDDVTYRLLRDRSIWRRLLAEDRESYGLDANQRASNEALLAMFDQEAVATITAPRECAPLPLESLSLTTVGYNELVLDLADRCDRTLDILVRDGNSTPLSLRQGWALAHHLARLAARETGGLIFDRHSERWWSGDRWGGIDPAPGQGAIADWVAIHDVAASTGPSHMHTHGMLHFGLPDLELVHVPRFHRAGAAKLINAACWRLISETLSAAREIRVGDEMTVTADDVCDALRESDEWAPSDGTTDIQIVAGDPHAALVQNRLLRILPAARYGLGTAALAACLVDLFPEMESMRVVCDERAMDAAHLRAREALPAERQRFRRGLHPGERLAVKVAFPCGEQGANEYMWVEVQYWHGDGSQATIDGILLNQPLHRSDLRLGQPLRVEQQAVYDWLRITPGGRQIGNFTAAALEP